MAKMTGGQALMQSLYREGVRVIFGLPGVQLYHAMDALYESGIQFITTRHEQAASYMADGYARASGQVGVALVVPGPGLQNASAGIGTAYAASSPILVVAGQVQRNMIGVKRGVLHEVHDQLDIIRPVTKWASRILDPADIPAAVHEAFFHLKTGRPRPVEIEIPPETLAEEAEVTLFDPEEYGAPEPKREDIEQGARLLADATNPLIWVGGGVISAGASEILQRLAEHLQAPVISTPEGKGALSDRHYLSLGVPKRSGDSLNKIIAQSDVVLAVGTRLAYPEMLDRQQVIQIDIDEEELGRNYSKTFGILGDARRALEELYALLSTLIPPRPSRQAELEAFKAKRFDPSIQIEPQGSLVRAIRAAMPDDGILVAGMTQVGYYSRTHYPVYHPRTYFTSSYYGNLGYAYPTALGAKVARPDRAVVAVSGDGGFLFNSQELATAVKYGINAVVIVFNDNAYGNVLRDQINRFQGRTIGAELHNPDFVKLAEAYGARGVRVEPEQLESALREALAIQAPTLIEVPVGMMPVPY
ncbi:MAG: thiamine pyrophosphate-binding protein [Nitrospinota bacterium]|nr:MAG: thiamine pyrophosphate-binding protein [Nitrospinota bacterium]